MIYGCWRRYLELEARLKPISKRSQVNNHLVEAATENAVCQQVVPKPGGLLRFLLAVEKRLSWRQDPPDVLAQVLLS
jgi:hypothetical protein